MVGWYIEGLGEDEGAGGVAGGLLPHHPSQRLLLHSQCQVGKGRDWAKQIVFNH